MSCTNPCRALAERVCECKFNARAQNACLQEVENTASVREPTGEENERCEELLDLCSCDALERENFAVCGISGETAL